MGLADLSKLSSADALELVARLHQANEQLQGSAVTLSRLSVALQESLEPAPSGAVGALQAIGQFLAVQHSYEDLAALVYQQSIDIFGMDGGVLFLIDDGSMLTVVTPGAAPSLDPMALEHIGALARRALDSRSLLSAPGKADVYPACIALPLSRMGQDVGAAVLYRAVPDEPALSAETWANLTIYAGTLGAICASMRQAEALRRDALLLESLLAERTRQVQNSRNILRVVFDHLPEGVILLDGDGMILAVNRFFSDRIAGMHPREIVGRSYAELRQRLHLRGMQRIGQDNEDRALVTLSDIGERRFTYAVERTATQTDDNAVLEFWRELSVGR
ncbi:MAG: PAS domain-containing protein [Roseiflexus sp.]